MKTVSILYRNEACCLKESKIVILLRKHTSMMRAMCGDEKHKRSKYVDLEQNYTSVGHDKQCSLVWSCDEERGWSCLMKGIRL